MAPIAGRGEEVRERLQAALARRRGRHASSATTATCTSARRCSPAAAGSSSTSRASRRARCPSAGASARRCATSPGMLRSFAYAASARRMQRERPVAGRLGGPGARGLPRGLPRRGRLGLLPPGEDASRQAAVDLRAREGRLRAALRAEQPPRLGRHPGGRHRAPAGGVRHDAPPPTEVEASSAASSPIPTRCSARTTRPRRRRRARLPPGARRASPPSRPGASRSSSTERPPGRRLRGRWSRALRCRCATSSRSSYGERRRVHARATRTPSCRRSASSTSTSPARAATRSSTSASARTCARSTASPASPSPSGRPAREVGQRRGRLQLLGRAPAPDALARRARGSGSCSSPASGTGTRYKFEIVAPDGELRLKADPFAFARRAPAQDRLGRAPPGARVGRRRSGSSRARRARPARPADVDLRGPPRLVAAEPAGGQPLADLPRAGRRARRLRHRPGLHPRRAAARDGPPVQRLVGLPGHLLLRADAASSAPPTTSASSSTACTARASA